MLLLYNFEGKKDQEMRRLRRIYSRNSGSHHHLPTHEHSSDAKPTGRIISLCIEEDALMREGRSLLGGAFARIDLQFDACRDVS